MQAIVPSMSARAVRFAESHARDCPRCDSRLVARSRVRGMFGRTLKVLGFRAYRCMDCWYRFTALDRGH